MALTATAVKERSLLGLKELSAAEISAILDRAAYWDAREEKMIPVLKDHFVANMFSKTVRAPASRSRWRRNGWVPRC
ncbi:hypothetical protein HMSSN139_02710 [Paenibacillus sp. HMSSN-139]|nr:hypothetical protein HMSSN139_02710 [Paenibacillus sp. HMSSN-139]